VEDVCSHFCDSVDISRKDLLCNLAIPTSRRFSKDDAVTLRNIQGVAAVPEGFGKVESIVPGGDGKIVLTDENGTSATSLVDWKML